MLIRLNKYIALCGICSRRKADQLITEGQIFVDEVLCTNLATSINSEKQKVKYKNQILTLVDDEIFIIINKPAGYVTTTNDEKNRPTVMELIPERFIRSGVKPVGRLDKDSEGLLLFTNNGSAAHLLNKPATRITKEYIVEINKPILMKDIEKIKKGVFIHQLKLKTRPANIESINKELTLLKIAITEGKNRQIRYTLQNLKYKVKKLKRISYGPLKLANLHKGTYRKLNKKEINLLLKLTTPDSNPQK